MCRLKTCVLLLRLKYKRLGDSRKSVPKDYDSPHLCRYSPYCAVEKVLAGAVIRMFQTEIEESSTINNLTTSRGLWYDAERLILEGFYGDEVTAFRAKKRWIEVLESNFLLERGIDFSVVVADEPSSVTGVSGGRMRESSDGRADYCYSVRCDFLSACGRYAFWRITHHQAPQVQYLLESAHLAKPSLVRVDPLPLPEDGWSSPVSKLDLRTIELKEEPAERSWPKWLRSQGRLFLAHFALWCRRR